MRDRRRGTLARRWEANTEMHAGGIRWGGMERIYLAQDGDHWRALVVMVINFGVANTVGTFLRISQNVCGHFQRIQLHGIIYIM